MTYYDCLCTPKGISTCMPYPHPPRLEWYPLTDQAKHTHSTIAHVPVNNLPTIASIINTTSTPSPIHPPPPRTSQTSSSWYDG